MYLDTYNPFVWYFGLHSATKRFSHHSYQYVKIFLLHYSLFLLGTSCVILKLWNTLNTYHIVPKTPLLHIAVTSFGKNILINNSDAIRISYIL